MDPRQQRCDVLCVVRLRHGGVPSRTSWLCTWRRRLTSSALRALTERLGERDPTEEPITATPLVRVNDSPMLSTIRRAITSTTSTMQPASSRIANSSPPSRATVSVARTQLLSLPAT